MKKAASLARTASSGMPSCSSLAVRLRTCGAQREEDPGGGGPGRHARRRERCARQAQRCPATPIDTSAACTSAPLTGMKPSLSFSALPPPRSRSSMSCPDSVRSILVTTHCEREAGIGVRACVWVGEQGGSADWRGVLTAQRPAAAAAACGCLAPSQLAPTHHGALARGVVLLGQLDGGGGGEVDRRRNHAQDDRHVACAARGWRGQRQGTQGWRRGERAASGEQSEPVWSEGGRPQAGAPACSAVPSMCFSIMDVTISSMFSGWPSTALRLRGHARAARRGGAGVIMRGGTPARQ